MRSKKLPQAITLGLAVALCSTLFLAGAETAQAKRRRRYNPRLARAPLVMTSFVQDGRIDVRRNEMLLFKFSALLRKKTVDDRSLRIAESTGTGLRSAPGARVVRGNEVRFDSTRTQRNYDESRK